MVLHKLSMDLQEYETTKRIDVVQGDMFSRTIEIVLYSGKFSWEVPEGTLVLIRYRKQNGSWGEYDTLPDGTAAWSVKGNTLTLCLVPQITSTPGSVTVSAVLIQKEKILNTFSVEVHVRENTMGKKSLQIDEVCPYCCVTGFLPAPKYGEEGQFLQIAEVNEWGKVTRVNAVDLSGGNGTPGGYYTPTVTQLNATDVEISYTASNKEMEEVSSLVVTLPMGPTGEKGEKGNVGPQGEAGPAGADGKSAYAYAQDGGYTGTEEEFAEKLVSGSLLVMMTLSEDGMSVTSDKTVAECITAYKNGTAVYCIAIQGDTLYCGPMICAVGDDTFGDVIFECVDSTTNNGLRILVAGSDDGESEQWNIQAVTKIPTALPNPTALTINGTVYDGSKPINMTIEGGSGDESVPQYVRTEAEAVARLVHQHQSNDSIVFPFLSDAHCGYYQDTEDEAAKLAGQLLDLVGKRIPYDFIVNGGDMASGAWNTTRELSFEQVEKYTELTREAQKGVPAIWTVGNHDDSPYQATADRVSQKETFALIGRKNRLSGATCPNGCNYGYLDLENRKLRVIYLDTDDKRSWGTVQVGASDTAPAYLNAHNVGGVQLQWLAEKALDFTGKANPAEWSIVVVSHAALNISGIITDAVSGMTYAHSTANAATVLNAYMNGKSGSITHNNIAVEYDFSALESRAVVICCVHGHNHTFSDEMVSGVLSIGCPNIMNGRERESDDGNTYTKTAGTADGTSFCILTIDRENRMIYADCVGVGYDREFAYTTEAVAYTNQIPISTDTDGSIFGGVGYAEGYYLSSGVPAAATGYYVSGFIPCKFSDHLHFENCQILTATDTHRFSFYDADKNHLNTIKTTSTAALNQVYGGDGYLDSIRIVANTGGSGNDGKIAYMRFCCSYIGDDSIVTVNEEIA